MKKIFTLALAFAAILPAAAEVTQDVIDSANIEQLSTTVFSSGIPYVGHWSYNYGTGIYLSTTGYITNTANETNNVIKSVDATYVDNYGFQTTVYVSNEPMATDGTGIDFSKATEVGTLTEGTLAIEGNYKYVALYNAGTSDTRTYKTFTFNWDAQVGVESIEAENGEAKYYNLQGVRVDNPEKGMFICVQNGKSTKVAIK